MMVNSQHDIDSGDDLLDMLAIAKRLEDNCSLISDPSYSNNNNNSSAISPQRRRVDPDGHICDDSSNVDSTPLFQRSNTYEPASSYTKQKQQYEERLWSSESDRYNNRSTAMGNGTSRDIKDDNNQYWQPSLMKRRGRSIRPSKRSSSSDCRETFNHKRSASDNSRSRQSSNSRSSNIRSRSSMRGGRSSRRSSKSRNSSRQSSNSRSIDRSAKSRKSSRQSRDGRKSRQRRNTSSNSRQSSNSRSSPRSSRSSLSNSGSRRSSKSSRSSQRSARSNRSGRSKNSGSVRSNVSSSGSRSKQLEGAANEVYHVPIRSSSDNGSGRYRRNTHNSTQSSKTSGYKMWEEYHNNRRRKSSLSSSFASSRSNLGGSMNSIKSTRRRQRRSSSLCSTSSMKHDIVRHIPTSSNDECDSSISSWASHQNNSDTANHDDECSISDRSSSRKEEVLGVAEAVRYLNETNKIERMTTVIGANLSKIRSKLLSS